MLPPARTGIGLALSVIERLADVDTCTFTVALLLPLFGSPVVEETESVCAIVLPNATVELTVTTKVKFAVVLATIVVVSVQVRPAHVHPEGPVKDTSVVLAGSVSVNTGAFAVAGPALLTVCIYVMLLPAFTGLGLAEFVTLKSAWVPDATAICTVAELLAVFVSRDVVAAAAVSVISVPAAVPAVTV